MMLMTLSMTTIIILLSESLQPPKVTSQIRKCIILKTPMAQAESGRRHIRKMLGVKQLIRLWMRLKINSKQLLRQSPKQLLNKPLLRRKLQSLRLKLFKLLSHPLPNPKPKLLLPTRLHQLLSKNESEER
jgi:hypothetical protein